MNLFEIKYLTENLSLIKEIEDFIHEWNNSNDYILTKTSGSTGNPKTIKIPKSKMIDSALMTGNFLGIKEGETALLCLSPKTIAGKMMLVRAITLKLKLTVTDINSNPFSNLDEKFDLIAIVPLQLSNILKDASKKLQKCKNILIGGAAVSSDVIENLKNKNLTVYQTYGMTETISHVAMRKIGQITDDSYTAIGSNYFSIEDNCLVIHSKLLDNHPLKTNDIVELIDDKHFKWQGRADFVINSGGIKIQPEIVEAKLSTFIRYPYFICGVQDLILGQKVVLCIENTREIKLNKTEILKVISNYEFPKEIYVFKEFIRTDSNKINRIITLQSEPIYKATI